MSTIDLGDFNGTHNNLGFVSDTDPSTYYKFSLNRPASFSASLNNLSAGAGIQLLNSNGAILQSSFVAGTGAEAFEVTHLAPGDYALQITSAGVDTAYNLSLTIDSLTGLSIDSGYFQVGKAGKVGFDFLLDGGKYEGEVAIFSLKGMEAFEPGSKGFIKEAARRALSSSEQGHIVIQDSTEGAKFEAEFPWEDNFNSGDYQKVKTFAMTPGELFGVMLVPNGTVQEVFQNPLIDGDKAPLFSLSTANPNDAFQFAQMADVFGNGTTFVMEDLRADNNPDKDYNDVVFNITGATGTAINLDEVINPEKDWRKIEIGKEVNQYVNQPPELLHFTMQPVYQVGEKICLTDTKVFDENQDVTQIKFWLKEDKGEWVEIESATRLNIDREGWASFDYFLSSLEHGNYQIKAVAVDKLGQTSEEVIQNFRVNAIPSQLQFDLSNNSYQTGDSISITNGKIYDADGVEDLAKVNFWLKESNGKWVNIGTVTQFTEEQEGWASFEFEFPQELTTGTYQIKAIASDQSGKSCEEVIHDFVVNPVNQIPTDLQFSVNKPIYKAGETIRLEGGKVYDANGANDLKNIAFWLQKEGDEWVPIRNVTQFDLGTKDWAKFDYELKNLKAGTYQIKAIAYDQAGAASDPLIRSFIVAEEIQKPATNVAPQYLQFALQPAYLVGETVSLLEGKVYDDNGAWNLNKVEFWLKKERGEWEKLTETTQFTADSEGWANFSYTLADLAVGDYQLKAIAYDKANAASNQVIQHFSILEESAPLPTNIPPQFLQFGLESFYQVGEGVELTGGKVYDANGAGNLAKIEFRLKKNEGKWKELETVTELDSETGNWGSFSYAINNLTAGNYRIEAIAYDQAGAKSNIVLQTFTVGYRNVETPNPRLYNRPPQGLVFSTFPLYTNAETLSFSGAKVYDRDGTGDIERIDFWLQKPTGEWVDIQDATQFTVDNKDWNRFDFSYDLTGLTPGDYQLWAVAYDKAGNQSNIARENFTVITDAGEGGLSDTVRLAIADAANLRSYDPQILEQTREWVVWVTPGQSSEQLATQIGAEDLGETGHIDNTYIWQFPNNATPALARNRLINLPGVEFAFPLVPVQLIPQFIPNDPLFANQWHLSNTGQTGGTIGADANVTTAWDSVQGRGVVIGIVDDGLQYNHPDLQANYRPLLSQDFNQAVDPQGNVFPYYLQVTLPNGTILEKSESEYGYDTDPSPTYRTTFTQDLTSLSPRERRIRDNNIPTNFYLDVPLTGVLTDMNVLVDITHRRVSDLDVSLGIPNEVTFNPLIGRYSRRNQPIKGGEDQDIEPIDLFSDIGGNGRNFTNTILNDQATQSIVNGTAPFTGTFKPESVLERLNNFYASGNWNLRILDDRQGNPSGLPGLLNRWKLEVSTYNPHGTSVAGIAAGVGNNNLGISGVAPAADVAGLRLIADQVTDQQIADALSHQNQEIHIYNNSWKAEDPLTTLPLDLSALEKGIEKGRGGLGSIFVFAGGNDGWLGGNVNYNGFANSRYVIPVAALDHNGEKTWYSEPGASLLISAPSSAVNGNGNLVGISSTDLIGDQGYDASDYTNRSTGTSSAAPVVSGTTALMLEANDDLTWRDVQHILVNTARKNDFGQIDFDGRSTDTGWWKNGAGLWVNHKYGFGAVDATAAVNAARTWVPVGAEVPDPVSSDWQNVGDAITDGDETGVTSTVTIDKNITVEKVEVVFKAEHPDWRDFTIRLTSPDGTQSVLAQAIPSENRDAAKPYELENDLEYWTFTSVHHWGESSQGEWTLQVVDEEGNQVQGEWESWKLNLYGTQPTVSVTATDANAVESGETGTFTMTRTGNTKYDLPVNYSVAGTATNGQDYDALTGSAIIPAGQDSVTVSVNPIDDTEIEGDEPVVLSITASNSYAVGTNSNATVTIADDDNSGETQRISVASDGTQGNIDSFNPAMSSNGRYIAFSSNADNLVPGDTNGFRDIFVYDRQTAQTARVSIASDGTQADGNSDYTSSISADGRYVAFSSAATNLVAGDTNGMSDIFVHDRQTGQTTRVNIMTDGNTIDNSVKPSISADGRYIAFTATLGVGTLDTGLSFENHVFLHDRQMNQTVWITENKGQSHQGGDASISADGRYVTFDSSSPDFVAGDTNNHSDVFLYDRITDQVSRVSVDSNGMEVDGGSYQSKISADGRYVAFTSWATNLAPGDANGVSGNDIFVHDRQTGQTTRVSIASDGTGGNDYSSFPSISADGRYIAFRSNATNLVAGDTNEVVDIFVHDRLTGETRRVSVASNGTQGNDFSDEAFLSGDGSYVGFYSAADNLVAGDTNGVIDVFIHKL
jgi:subtilisin-like proprotein convertase family protein